MAMIIRWYGILPCNNVMVSLVSTIIYYYYLLSQLQSCPHHRPACLPTVPVQHMCVDRSRHRNSCVAAININALRRWIAASSISHHHSHPISLSIITITYYYSSNTSIIGRLVCICVHSISHYDCFFGFPLDNL